MSVAVKGGEAAIDNAHRWLADLRRGDRDLAPLQTQQVSEQLTLATSRVMAEGAIYDRELAALAIKQARGDLIEAIFLLRAYRPLPRSPDQPTTRTETGGPFEELHGTLAGSTTAMRSPPTALTRQALRLSRSPGRACTLRTRASPNTYDARKPSNRASAILRPPPALATASRSKAAGGSRSTTRRSSSPAATTNSGSARRTVDMGFNSTDRRAREVVTERGTYPGAATQN